MGEAKRRGSFEERRDKAIIERFAKAQEAALNPKPRRTTPSKVGIAAALAASIIPGYLEQ